MKHGEVNHEDDPLYHQLICRIVYEMDKIEKHEWSGKFRELTKETPYDINKIRCDVWDKLK